MMKIFSGFPSGKLAVTPIPNLFFTELLPAITDAAELKVTLHIFWLIANAKSRDLFVRASELRGDRTLMPVLTADELTRALDAAVTRGTLLRLESKDSLFFVNSDSGRRAFEKMEKEITSARSTTPAERGEPALSRPNIFTLYEQNIGLLTPIIAEELKDAEKEYLAEWIEDAFKIAVEQNVRKWSYVEKILERWQTEGRPVESKKNKTWYSREHAKHINR